MARCYLWIFTLYMDIKIGEGGCWMLDWPVWGVAVRLAVACGVCGGVFLCCPFSHGVSWMGS